MEKEGKWILKDRPIQLSDVYGCKDVKDYVKAKFKDKLPFDKTFLLKGTTGIGKTTITNILAGYILGGFLDNGFVNWYNANGREILNNNFTGDCKKIVNVGKQDLIDEINQFCMYNSLYSKNKVIIIEEAQQLSDSAIKSLLTILEDTSKPNVHFILIAMDTNLPRSIEDRCTIFKLPTPTPIDIMKHLKTFLEKKGIWQTLNPDFQTEGLYMIACASKGSFRSAINTLEDCILLKKFDLVELGEYLNTSSIQTAMAVLKTLVNYKKEPQFKEYIYSFLSGQKDFVGIFNYFKTVLLSAYAHSIFGKDLIDNPYFQQVSKDLASSPYFHILLKKVKQVDTRTKGFVNDFIFLTMIYEFLEQVEAIEAWEQKKKLLK